VIKLSVTNTQLHIYWYQKKCISVKIKRNICYCT